MKSMNILCTCNEVNIFPFINNFTSFLCKIPRSLQAFFQEDLWYYNVMVFGIALHVRIVMNRRSSLIADIVIAYDDVITSTRACVTAHKCTKLTNKHFETSCFRRPPSSWWTVANDIVLILTLYRRHHFSILLSVLGPRLWYSLFRLLHDTGHNNTSFGHSLKPFFSQSTSANSILGALTTVHGAIQIHVLLTCILLTDNRILTKRWHFSQRHVIGFVFVSID